MLGIESTAATEALVPPAGVVSQERHPLGRHRRSPTTTDISHRRPQAGADRDPPAVEKEGLWSYPARAAMTDAVRTGGEAGAGAALHVRPRWIDDVATAIGPGGSGRHGPA